MAHPRQSHERQTRRLTWTGQDEELGSERMTNVHYYVHGRGRGHATRSLAVLRALSQSGHTLQVCAGEDALPLIRAEFPAQAVTSLPPRPSTALVGLAAQRFRDALDSLRRARPAIVVSDGDGPALWAAGVLGIPAVALGRGLIFSHCHRPAALEADPWHREAVKAWVSSRGARRFVPVSFAPLEPRGPDVHLARPPAPPVERARAETLVCYFRDDNGDEVLRHLVALGESPLLFGQRDPGIAGVTVQAIERERFLAALSRARAVIASAGSQLIGEAVALGVPFFGVYAPDDDEQAMNVAMLRMHGVGDGQVVTDCGQAELQAFLARAGAQGFQRLRWAAPDVARVVVEQVAALA
jgi:hypothetical protein